MDIDNFVNNYIHNLNEFNENNVKKYNIKVKNNDQNETINDIKKEVTTSKGELPEPKEDPLLKI